MVTRNDWWLCGGLWLSKHSHAQDCNSGDTKKTGLHSPCMRASMRHFISCDASKRIVTSTWLWRHGGNNTWKEGSPILVPSVTNHLCTAWSMTLVYIILIIPCSTGVWSYSLSHLIAGKNNRTSLSMHECIHDPPISSSYALRARGSKPLIATTFPRCFLLPENAQRWQHIVTLVK